MDARKLLLPADKRVRDSVALENDLGGLTCKLVPQGRPVGHPERVAGALLPLAVFDHNCNFK